MSIHTRPSSTRTSIRSPGPYGGRPETNRRSRSWASSDSDTPNTELSSESSAPWCWITYGTTESSLGRRSEARAGRVSFRPSAGGKDAPQAIGDRLAELRRREHLRVRAEGEDPVDEGLPVADLHGGFGPAVRTHGARVRRCPPGDVGGKRDDGRPVLVRLPRAGRDVRRGGEALGRGRPLSGILHFALDPGDTEGAHVSPSAVVSDHVPLPGPCEQAVRLDLPVGD